jgi:hypothetical protein
MAIQQEDKGKGVYLAVYFCLVLNRKTVAIIKKVSDSVVQGKDEDRALKPHLETLSINLASKRLCRRMMLF